jgi:tryptophan synthase alpha chain
MNRRNCTIVTERLPDGRFRASCGMFPDCEATAATEGEARAAVEHALESLLANDAMNPIDAVFQRLRADRRKAFIPFVTAGDPDLAATAAAVRTLADAGASVIEIGFPYSDPIADGPVIQASYTRALEKGLHIEDIFRFTGEMTASGLPTPLVGMVSYSLVQRRGLESFVAQAQAAGLSGLIVPDLPIDEAEPLAAICRQRDCKLIQLVTPTTPRERAVRIARLSTGFLYCVSVTGITGERRELPPELADQLRWLKQQTEVPLCVGFGISAPDQVHMLRDVADGIIVGSAIVRRLEQASRRPLAEVTAEVAALARSLTAALNPA